MLADRCPRCKGITGYETDAGYVDLWEPGVSHHVRKCPHCSKQVPLTMIWR
jgi:phage FluMu protein Com